MAPDSEYFVWRGEYIHDIYAWATQRGERMVKYVAVRTIPSFAGVLVTEERQGEMPQSFWDNLRITDDWIYEEIQ